MSNLIDRQAAIDALRYAQHRFTVADEAGGMGTVKWREDVIYFAAAERVLTELPSVQPEPPEDICGECDAWNKYKSEIKALPSAQPRWIPVAEALPRDDEEVIVTCLDDSGDTPYSYTTVAWHYKGMWVCDNMRCLFVIAWMPLPEPWRGGQDGTT